LAVALVAGILAFPQLGNAEEDTAKTPVEQGRELAVEFCQACHYFEGTDQAGTAGPPLLAIKPRFPDRQKLVEIINDPQVATKPYTMMPPFGRNGLIDQHQIELIVDYLYTL
jgi:sulfur-oxidizing protein SoxX